MNAGNHAKQIISAAEKLADDIRGCYPSLGFYFLPHHRGQRGDQIIRTLEKLDGHPAYDAARDLLNIRTQTDQSALLGIAIGHERGLFGMRGKPAYLGFISINLDQYSGKDETLFGIYHLVGQFFDLLNAINPSTLRGGGEIVLQPKRNEISTARSHLKADLFSAMMMTTDGYKDAVRDLARLRGLQALTAQAYQRPEEYPYAISIDVAEYAVGQTEKMSGVTLMKQVHQLSTGISRTFDKSNIETWRDFTSPAQTMAWVGNTPDQILGAAIYSCPNPFIKSIGNMVAEMTHINPAQKDSIEQNFNPYVDLEINHIAHDRAVEETFEMVMIHSIEADSALPLIRVANNQNESMLKGKMMGWCAHALHASAKAYQNARQRGVPADQAARLEFQSAKSQTEWNSITRVHDHIVGQRRSGIATTMSDLANWCKNSADFRPIMESLQYTLEDPSYARKLAMANEMPMPNMDLAPRVNTPSFTPSVQPSFAPSLSLGGGMGGSMGGGGFVQRQTAAQTTSRSDEDQ